MKFKAKLNLKLYKLYIAAILLFGIVILGWYGVYFLNKNTIFMEDNLPMDNRIKLLFSIAIGVVVLSWTIPLFTLVRQIWMGQAFSMDEEGIHSTATGTIILPARRLQGKCNRCLFSRRLIQSVLMWQRRLRDEPLPQRCTPRERSFPLSQLC